MNTEKLVKKVNKHDDDIVKVHEQLDTKAKKENSVKWINVVELGIDNTGLSDISDKLQEIINNVPDYSTLYFPSGKYLFNKGVTDDKRLTFKGDSYFITDIPRLKAGHTEFITKGKSNITILNFTDGQHVVKGISFYSDSLSTTETQSEPTSKNPKFHWQTSKTFDNVNAIKDLTNIVGSYYENIYISGFSGVGIEMGYYSTLNNAMIFSCGLGLKSGIDSIVTNSKMWGCSDSAYIKVGTSLNNIRAEEVEKVGIKTEGSTKFNNVTIDQCGYCGLYIIDGAKEITFNGKITRCSQYYFNTDFETYKTIEGKIEEAFSLIYTNGYTTDCTFILSGSNKANYKDGASNLHTINILKGNLSDTKIIINTDGENLVHYGNGNVVLVNKDTFKYNNGSLLSKNGIDLTTNGSELIRHRNGRIYVNDGNNIFNKSFIAEVGLVLGSTSSNSTNFGYAYGGTWANIGSLVIGNETIYFHKKISM